MSTSPALGAALPVGELAAAAGISPDTVRYYERAGLLAAPERTPAGYRTYDDAALDRLRFIQGAQRLGLRLREIRDLLAIRATGECPCAPADQLQRRRLGEIDADMARLAALRAEPGRWSTRCPPPTASTRFPGLGDPGEEVTPDDAHPGSVVLLRRSQVPTRSLRLRLLMTCWGAPRAPQPTERGRRLPINGRYRDEPGLASRSS